MNFLTNLIQPFIMLALILHTLHQTKKLVKQELVTYPVFSFSSAGCASSWSNHSTLGYGLASEGELLGSRNLSKSVTREYYSVTLENYATVILIVGRTFQQCKCTALENNAQNLKRELFYHSSSIKETVNIVQYILSMKILKKKIEMYDILA